MGIETEIHLNKFKPRPFQYPLFDAFENKHFRKMVCIWPRRCLAGDTPIVMANGSIKQLKYVEPGEKIISWNGSEFEEDIVVDVWATGRKKIVGIYNKYKDRLFCSHDHKVLRSLKGKDDWVRAGDLSYSSTLVSYAGMENKGTLHDLDLFNKHLGDPALLFDADNESIKVFLQHVLNRHGSLELYRGKVSLIIASHNYDYLEGYKWILRKWSIFSRLRHNLRCNLVDDSLCGLIVTNHFPALLKKLDMVEKFKNTYPHFLIRLSGIKSGRYDAPVNAVKCTAMEDTYDLETAKNHNFVANGYVVHNSGKDISAFNLMIREALRKVGVYYYIFPSYSQARKVIWDSITNDGTKFIDFIPPELVEKTNSQEMKIYLVNGSLIQLIGSDNIDSVVGSNPRGCIFSEYALQHTRAYQFIRPILAANDGWALFVSTPRGKNHFWELYQIAQKSKEWFCSKLTLDDTNHIPMHEIERERAEGLMSEDLIQQEYYTSFTMGVEGAYYTKYLDKLRIENKIGDVPWEPSFSVNTAWDLGVRDSTTIIFFQIVGQSIRIIDCYENSKEGLEHYVNVIKSKPYTYGRHIAPHDIQVKEFSSGVTRIDKARNLGVKFMVARNISIVDGIEAVRSSFNKMWFDEKRCAPLLKAIENYRQEYDDKKRVYKSQPLHNFASHFADALRYLCVSLPRMRDGLTPEDIDKNYYESLYGNDQSNMPSIFRTDLPEY